MKTETTGKTPQAAGAAAAPEPPPIPPSGENRPETAAGTGSILKIVLVSLLLGSSIVTPGLILYLRNSSEFTFRLAPLLLCLGGLWTMIALAAAAIQYPLRRTRYFEWVHAGLLSLALTIYLQSAFFTLVFSVDAEDTVLPDSGMALIALLDFVLLAAPVVLALIYRKPITHSSVKLTVIVLLSQFSPLAWELLVYQPTNYDYYDNAVDSTDKFTFANRENIILVMVDAMSEVSLKKALNFSPRLSEALKDFSCFDRLESPIPQTRFAVPSMISGQEFPATLSREDDNIHLAYLKTSSVGPDSLIVNLKKEGYRMEGYPFLLQTINYNPKFWDNIVARVNSSRSIGQFLDVWFYQITPFALKYCFAQQFLSFRDHFVTPSSEQTNFPGETHDMIFLRRLGETAKIGPVPKVFKYYHLQGTHSPYTMNEDTEKTLDTDEVRQLCGSMRNVELLLEKLKQFGLYDQSLIVITGDHTEFYTPETIMMIKRPGDKQKEITFHSQPCKVREIATTILAEKKFRPADQSVFSREMKAANSVRRLPERPTIPFSALRPVDKVSFEFDPGDTFSQSFQVNHDVLMVDDHNVSQDQVFNVEFLAENIATGKLYLTSTEKISKLTSPLYYQVPLGTLPDGEYRLYQHSYEEENQPRANCLPRFLRIAKGKMTLPSRPAYVPPPQPLNVGESISFDAMRLNPSFSFSSDAKQLDSSLLISQNSVVTVRLPPARKPLKLEITLHLFPELRIPKFKVYHEKQLLADAETRREITTRIPVAVPAGLSELKLSIKPEVDHPEKVKFRLKEIKLLE